ncbi:DegT/DnrJ/EryC1/StrS family aminotransferase [uncultured Desulfovibrio sp.]|uniref:DegT/DnrJ/EryC1/StrS family aminotransferase n=1 Tax=uncultured Desulfovibrio sp. TaxID=167968 RepID=UPI002615BE70|nr:DegT/DnrJ/EryC1/StrS family aminotransferase [uncultured Desulfovibrio sp.]
MDIKINFSGRAIRYTEEEIAVVVEAMRNADPLTQGQYMRAFESKFARYQGVAEGTCFTTMNGCAALEMSGPLCPGKPRDAQVHTPPPS